jgi:hypothetical protein
MPRVVAEFGPNVEKITMTTAQTTSTRTPVLAAA